MLFPSTLLIANSLSATDSILHDLNHHSIVNNPDILVISEYTIESIRSINNFLSLLPYSHQSKIVIIPEAHLLNQESQNALLKNLEEPGPNNYFILLTIYPNSLIPTILSRCQVVKTSYQTVSDHSLPILNFPTNIAESLAVSESLPKDKTELLSYLNQQIILFQKQLSTNPSLKISSQISRLVKATKMLSANIDSKSVADFLLLS